MQSENKQSNLLKKHFSNCRACSVPQWQQTQEAVIAYVKRQLQEARIPITEYAGSAFFCAELAPAQKKRCLVLDCITFSSYDLYVADEAALQSMRLLCARYALLLTLAQFCANTTFDQFPAVRILFRPNGQTALPAEFVSSCGDDVTVFTLQLCSDLPDGLVNLQQGLLTVSKDQLQINVTGLASHGSAPQEGADALVASAYIHLVLQTMVSRRHDPRKPLVLTINGCQGGQSYNIIAARTTLQGYVYCGDIDHHLLLEDTLRQIVITSAQACGCTAEIVYVPSVPPIVNNDTPFWRRIAKQAAEQKDIQLITQMAPRLLPDPLSVLQNYTDMAYGFWGLAGLADDTRQEPDLSTLERCMDFYIQVMRK